MISYRSEQILNNASMATGFASAAVLVHNVEKFNIQIVFSGNPVGTFKLQSSADLTYDINAVTNWTDVANSSQSITASGDIEWKVSDPYKFVRVYYSATSGTGSVSGNIFGVSEG